MIATLSGKCSLVQPGEAIVRVGGIGYRVWVRKDLDFLPIEGELIIRQVVKEDSHDLYGFQFEAEEAIFVAITRIKGCGPKLAMTILSGISTEDFNYAVSERDLKRLQSIKGVGASTAMRILEAFT